APPDQRHRAEPGLAGREGEAQRPPVIVAGAALPAREVGRGVVAAGLEQEHRAAALGQLAGDHAAAGAGSDDHDLEALRGHPPIPRYDQSLAMRMASGEWKSISW